MTNSPFIYGMHDRSPSNILDGKGTTFITEAIGHDPNDHHGGDYSDIAGGVMVRLNNGYRPNGTIPRPEHMVDFVARVRNFVAASRGNHDWIIGNEPNHSQERPHGMTITPEYYAQVFTLCWEAIHGLDAHKDDRVITAGIAPWNMESGNWLEYLHEMLERIDATGTADGIALHAYTHGANPFFVTSDERRHGWLWHFRTYQDQIKTIPPGYMRHLPLYITEANQGGPWENVNRGWVQAAYKEIDDWNKAGNQEIRALVLYRWAYDQWSIDRKPNVVADLHAAMEHSYTWTQPEPPELEPRRTLEVVATLRVDGIDAGTFGGTLTEM